VARGWTRLHNDEIHSLYASPNIIRMIKSRGIIWARHIARIEQMRNEYNILVGKPYEKIQLGRPRRRLEDTIRMNLGK
jgi:hypothetical protein